MKICLQYSTRQNVAARNENFVYAFVDVNVVSGNDVFDVRFCKLTPFCTNRSNVRNKIILMFSGVRLESGKMQE